MAKLRRINKKITPIFAYDPETQTPLPQVVDELKDGDKGKGPLVRKYIKDLDMDFYAGRAAEKGRESLPVTFRIPEDIMKDIGIMIATGKTRFRDKSEFFRTAVFILMNYYSSIVEGQFREKVSLRKTQDLIEYERAEALTIRNIIESFDNQFSTIANYGDEVLHKFLAKVTDSVKSEKKAHVRNKLISAFSERMEKDNIDPSDYFDNYKKE